MPAANTTTRPFSRWRMALRRMYGSATAAICTAESTRVGWPWCSRASCRARALMTVPSIPMASEVARSMPAPAPVVPRQMLPPPTITASSRSRCSRVWAMSTASCSTTAASMVSSDADEARAPPDIFRTMRRRSPTVDSAADHDLGEPRHRGRTEERGDGLLLVLHVRLVEEYPLLVPAPEAPLHDLGQGGVRLPLVAGDLLDGLPLRGHLGLGDFVPGDVRGPSEGDVGGDVVGQLDRAAVEGHHHRVHAPPGLEMEVPVDHASGRGLDADHLADRDVLLEGDLEVVDLVV